MHFPSSDSFAGLHMDSSSFPGDSASAMGSLDAPDHFQHGHGASGGNDSSRKQDLSQYPLDESGAILSQNTVSLTQYSMEGSGSGENLTQYPISSSDSAAELTQYPIDRTTSGHHEQSLTQHPLEASSSSMEQPSAGSNHPLLDNTELSDSGSGSGSQSSSRERLPYGKRQEPTGAEAHTGRNFVGRFETLCVV